MADGKAIQCKTKGCNNPVLDGKYCLQCTQVRKENKNKGLAVAGAVGIPAIGYAITLPVSHMENYIHRTCDYTAKECTAKK